MIHYLKKIYIQLQINSKDKNQKTIKLVVVGEPKLEETLWRNKDNIKVVIVIRVIFWVKINIATIMISQTQTNSLVPLAMPLVKVIQ